MENKRKALGKGLEQLFSNEVIDFDNFEKKIVNETKDSDIVEIPLTEIRSNPYQPRKEFDEQSLREFAESIKEHGVIQPIIVKKSIKGYEIIAGERRTRASKMAGKETIPAIIREFTDQEMMEIALIENIQREDLNPIEEAEAFVEKNPDDKGKTTVVSNDDMEALNKLYNEGKAKIEEAEATGDEAKIAEAKER
jgi:ParB family chromosome partitioning protein